VQRNQSNWRKTRIEKLRFIGRTHREGREPRASLPEQFSNPFRSASLPNVVCSTGSLVGD